MNGMIAFASAAGQNCKKQPKGGGTNDWEAAEKVLALMKVFVYHLNLILVYLMFSLKTKSPSA
jgi:hypothetical protein